MQIKGLVAPIGQPVFNSSKKKAYLSKSVIRKIKMKSKCLKYLKPDGARGILECTC